MNMVPLGPITMVRAPGWPVDQISALKPAGRFSLSTGSLSAAAAIGGVGCGLRFTSCWLAEGLDLSRGLKPGGVCAAAGHAAKTNPAAVPASQTLRVMQIATMDSPPLRRLSR